MLKILPYLKKSSLIIVITLVFLFLQAMCDLALPGYTSNIVNIGIQQGGIEHVCPDVVRKNQMEKILLFTTENNKILENFTLLSKENLDEKTYNSYVKKYPALETEELYVLNKVSEATLEELNIIFANAMFPVATIEKGGEEVASMIGQFAQSFPQELSENLTILDMLKMLPDEERTGIVTNIHEKMVQIPEMMVEQSALQFVKDEYSAIGMDTDKMQTNYILFARRTNGRTCIC